MSLRTHRLSIIGHRPAVVLGAVVAATLTLAAPSPSAPLQAGAEGADLDAALIEAAQQQDLEQAKSLLEQGADVDAASRYGATPLFFAADKGNLAMVKLFLEAGARLDVVDTFYQATPLTFALFKSASSPDHRAVVLELLDRGSSGAGQALSFAARSGDLEMAKAALGVDGLEIADLESALAAATAGEHEQIVELLVPRIPDDTEEPTVEVSPETLAGYAGHYRNEEMGVAIQVFLEEEELKLQVDGQQAASLGATTETAFDIVEVPNASVEFFGRGGLTEGFVLDQNGQHRFERFDPSEAGDAEEAPKQAAALPEVERRPARPWGSFRGPGASGIGDGQGAPTSWDGKSGENVLWKTPVPGLGLSSPVVWDDHVFVTTAISSAGDSTFRTGLYGDVDAVQDDSEHTWKVYALNRATGEVLWERTAAQGVPKVQRHTKSSHANPTPATDGEHLVAHFGSEGIFTYDFDGNLLWEKDLGTLVSGWFYDASYEWGFSSSPILHDGKVIVQTDVQDQSFIAAFDVETGEELWRTERDEIPTWGTPSILPSSKGDEIVTNGTTIRGHDAKTGEELWTLGPNSEVTVGTPVVADGIAYVTGGYPPVRPIYAVRPGGRGDLSLEGDETESEHVAWSTDRGGTYIPTPLVYEGQLYMLHNNGRLSAHDAGTGERIYRARVGRAESFSGSPVAADGRLYFTTEEGRTYVVRTGPVFEVIEENELGEVVMTTPAISDGTMILRGMHHVFALGETPEQDEEDGEAGQSEADGESDPGGPR